MMPITIAAIMIVATTVIHTGGMIVVLKVFQPHKDDFKTFLHRRQVVWIGSTVLLMAFVSLIEVTLWAMTYLMLNAIEGFERALYFSMVTFTTLGYGDIVLDEHWRLLASFEAANGIIMFGWTTAIVVAAVQRIFFNK